MKKIKYFECIVTDPETGLCTDSVPYAVLYSFERAGVYYYGLTNNPGVIDESGFHEQGFLDPIEASEMFMCSPLRDGKVEFIRMLKDDWMAEGKEIYYGIFDFMTETYEIWKMPSVKGAGAERIGSGIIVNVILDETNED